MLYLGENLHQWDLFRYFADEIGKKPMKLSEICGNLFPNSYGSKASTDRQIEEAVLQLGNLGTMGRIGSINQPLLPTRLHLFFRGLPQHFVCSDHQCSVRLAKNGEFLGRLYLCLLYTSPSPRD